MTNEFAVGNLIIKSSMVTREQYDGKSASLAQKSAEVKALRRENDRLRNWATGLAVLSGALGIGIMVLFFPII
jgi:hypothetical protein|tara:strand:+ start:1241 stop:1459 length:219 start_codon:yes stop_codon:yes gene_type:complete